MACCYAPSFPGSPHADNVLQMIPGWKTCLQEAYLQVPRVQLLENLEFPASTYWKTWSQPSRGRGTYLQETYAPSSLLTLIENVEPAEG